MNMTIHDAIQCYGEWNQKISTVTKNESLAGMLNTLQAKPEEIYFSQLDPEEKGKLMEAIQLLQNFFKEFPNGEGQEMIEQNLFLVERNLALRVNPARVENTYNKVRAIWLETQTNKPINSELRAPTNRVQETKENKPISSEVQPSSNMVVDKLKELKAKRTERKEESSNSVQNPKDYQRPTKKEVK